MKNEEVREKVRAFLEQGVARSEVFAHLSAQGASHRQVAFCIASHLDPAIEQRHRSKVWTLVGMMLVQAVLGYAFGYYAGEEIGAIVGVALGIVIAGAALLFAWGFLFAGVGAYNGFIGLCLIQVPGVLANLLSNPSLGLVSVLAIEGGVLAYVWHVRNCLFPAFGLFGPKKVGGKYVFSA